MLFGLFLAGVLVLTGGTPVASQLTPCANLSSLAAAFRTRNPSFPNTIVPAEVAEACLSSVPINQEEDGALMEELGLYLDWQSTLAYLINPPAGYTGDRVNIRDNFQSIYQKLGEGQYPDEYHFQLDLSLALTLAYDFHLQWTPDILAVFSFMRGTGEDFSLVSISSDGQALPELYNYCK